MSGEAKSEKYRGLSIAALVTGILSIISFIVIVILSPFNTISDFGGLVFNFKDFVIYSLPGICLPIAAIICGSIDLKRIQSGRYSSKGKGWDKTGIVLGYIFLLPILLYITLEIIVNRHAILDIFFDFEEIPLY